MEVRLLPPEHLGTGHLGKDISGLGASFPSRTIPHPGGSRRATRRGGMGR
jgi:hypothetical protein